MNFKDPYPVQTPARLAVLLLFMPSERTDRIQQAWLRTLADSLQHQLSSQVQVLKIDELAHQDVFRSFDITQTPSFVLVQRGIELWRQVGMPQEDLSSLLSERLVAASAQVFKA
ncbi:thioredoxin family protein [Larkinella sp. GY13]